MCSYEILGIVFLALATRDGPLAGGFVLMAGFGDESAMFGFFCKKVILRTELIKRGATRRIVIAVEN